MTTQELLIEFVKKGGVITLYSSNDAEKPIRFSARLNGIEWAGRTGNLGEMLADTLEPPRDHDDDLWFDPLLDR